MRHLPLLVGVLGGAWLIAGCADSSADPAPGAVEPAPAIVTPAERVQPSLTLHPALAGTFVGDANFDVVGTALPGSGALTTLTVGEDSAAFSPAGAFSHSVRPTAGINIVPLKIEADDRGRAVEAVSVFGGAVHEPGAKLERAMLVHLGQELLDDDDDDVDDVARIVEILLVDPGFAAWLATLQFGEDGGMQVELFEAERSKVDFRAVQLPNGAGCLTTIVKLGDATVDDDPGFRIRLRVSGFAAAFGEEITVTGDEATISGDLCPSIDVNGDLKTEVITPEVDIVGIGISTDVYPNMAETLPETVESLKELANSFMADALANSLGTLLDEFLGGFEFELPIWAEPAVSAKFSLDRMSITEGAVALELSHQPTVTFGLPTSPPGAGSLATDDPGPNTRLSSRPLAVAISDDLANQMLFSFWWAGVIAKVGFGELLVGADMSSLPKVFQPLSGVQLEMGLPPTLMAPKEREFPFDLAAGEMKLTLNVGPDRRFVCSIHLRAGADLVGQDDGSIQLKLDNRARKITVAAAVRELPAGLDPGDIAALLRLMLPALLGKSNAALPGLSIPNIDLSKLELMQAVDQFDGKVLSLTSPDVKRIGEGGGYVVFEGGAILQDAPPPPPTQ